MKPSLTNNTISEALTNSKASIELKRRLNNCFEVAIWSNEYDHVTYRQIRHHTLGLYLEGGYSTWRLDNKSAGNGAPDKFCLLPAGHHSEWEVGERQRFAHLYFSDSTLKRVALESFDMDPRMVELSDRTYFEDKELLQRCQSFVRQSYYYPEDRLAAHESMWQIVGSLLQGYCAKSPKKTMYRGGFTKLTLTRIVEYMNANIDKKVSIEELAVIAGVSPFHFRGL